jgi:protein CpxP
MLYKDYHMKKNTHIIAVLLAAILSIGSIQAANHHNKNNDGKIMHMLKKLDLTDAQHAAIKTITETQNANKRAHKEQMKPIRQAMRKLVEADNIGILEVSHLAHQKALLDESLTVMKVQSMHQVHQQLTTEQRAVLSKMQEKHVDH